MGLGWKSVYHVRSENKQLFISVTPLREGPCGLKSRLSVLIKQQTLGIINDANVELTQSIVPLIDYVHLSICCLRWENCIALCFQCDIRALFTVRFPKTSQPNG